MNDDQADQGQQRPQDAPQQPQAGGPPSPPLAEQPERPHEADSVPPTEPAHGDDTVAVEPVRSDAPSAPVEHADGPPTDHDAPTQYIAATPSQPPPRDDVQHTAVLPSVPAGPSYGQDAGYGPAPTSYGQQPPASQQQPYGAAAAGYGQQQQTYGQQQQAYGQQPYGQTPQQPYGSPQPTYGQAQPSYGQGGAYAPTPAYGQPAYGAPAYGQAGYGAPGYPPAGAQPGKRGHGLLYSLLALVVLIAVLAVISVVAKVPAGLYPKKLSHSAVEKYVGTTFGVSGVNCNGGSDFTIKNGNTFTCTAAQGVTFTVKLTNGDGNYEVSKNG